MGAWSEDFFCGGDGAKLFYRFFAVPGARHTVIMIHGYGEHSGRYVKFPEKMRGLSAQFAIMDLRGMGRSEGIRGDIAEFDDYLKDMNAFIAHLRQKHAIPKQCIFLGHSLGGLIAIRWAMKVPEGVKLLILSAPFLGLRLSGWIAPANQLLRCVMPRFVYKNPVRSRTLSHDPSEVANHKRDPLILRFMSARLLAEILRTMARLQGQAILSVPFPVHMLVPGKEYVVDPKASALFFDRLVTPRKEKTSFDGFFHEIFNEQEQQKAFNVLKTIIEDCV